MKSEIENELNNSLTGIETLGGYLIKTKTTKLPNERGIRSFVIIKKNTKTNLKYPRQYNQILKKPL